MGAYIQVFIPQTGEAAAACCRRGEGDELRASRRLDSLVAAQFGNILYIIHLYIYIYIYICSISLSLFIIVLYICRYGVIQG